MHALDVNMGRNNGFNPSDTQSRFSPKKRGARKTKILVDLDISSRSVHRSAFALCPLWRKSASKIVPGSALSCAFYGIDSSRSE